jgi:uncharacterized membrane protein
MKHFAAAYAGTLLAMTALDLVWLGLIAKPLYAQGIGHLMAPTPNVPVAVLFYALYALGLVIFAVAPQFAGPGWMKTFAMAALFGFFAYATYDLTNLATLRDWPPRLALIDIAWGTVVSGVSALGGRLAMQWASTR